MKKIKIEFCKRKGMPGRLNTEEMSSNEQNNFVMDLIISVKEWADMCGCSYEKASAAGMKALEKKGLTIISSDDAEGTFPGELQIFWSGDAICIRGESTDPADSFCRAVKIDSVPDEAAVFVEMSHEGLTFGKCTGRDAWQQAKRKAMESSATANFPSAELVRFSDAKISIRENGNEAFSDKAELSLENADGTGWYGTVC